MWTYCGQSKCAISVRGKRARCAWGLWQQRSVAVAAVQIALYDYADYGERLLGFSSWVLYPATNPHNFDPVVERFRARFGARLISLERTDAYVRDPHSTQH